MVRTFCQPAPARSPNRFTPVTAMMAAAASGPDRASSQCIRSQPKSPNAAAIVAAPPPMMKIVYAQPKKNAQNSP
jgi:hypothetical protein